MSDKEGWVLLSGCRMSHFFGEDGRSLCHKWAYFGGDRYDTPDKNRCKECERRSIRKQVAEFDLRPGTLGRD